MGCDIHSMMEVRNPIDRTWATATTFSDEHGYTSPIDEPIGGRNYALFAILANVRNGYGFAGCDTGDALKPIAMPRGIPEDASPAFQKWATEWGADGHSHTHHSLAELLAYDYHRQLVARGVLTLEEYSYWTGWGMTQGREPDGWCGGVSGAGIRVVDSSEGAAILNGFGNTMERRTPEKRAAIKESKIYVSCEWRVQYLARCGELWTGAIPAMFKEVRERGLNHRDIRICMFFDN